MKNNILHKVGSRSRAAVVGLTTLALATPLALADPTGNGGADAIVSGVTDLTPVVVAVIAACLALGFVIMASVIGWRVLKKFLG